MIHVIGNIAINIDAQLNEPLTPHSSNEIANPPSLDLTGHGALQAISAARCGARVSLVSTIGTDLLGQYALDILRKEGVQTSALGKDPKQSSLAISLNILDQKTNIVALDDNSLSRDIVPADHFNARNMVVISSAHAADDALLSWLKQIKSNEAKIMLCLPLGKSLDKNLAALADIIVCDESSEVSDINDDVYLITTKSCGTQGASAQKAGKIAYDLEQPKEQGCDDVILDIFCGFFAACLQACLPLERSLKTACTAATLSVQNHGAYNAIPYLGYLEDIIEGPYEKAIA